jgi:iron complex outermembrane receptor protein
MTRQTKILGISTVATLALVAAMAPAQAQAQEQAQAAGAAADASLAPGDIVVTAQRRSELARNVPLSVTALSGEALRTAGVTDTLALQQMTPGLKMDRIGNFTLPAIRGITTNVTGPGADANVAIYLDGVYQPSTVSNTFDLPDVERIEVLKGPQGTLFGRNATGGAIQVFTREPSYTPAGSFTIGYGNYNDFVVKGSVSAPLVADRVAVALSGFYHRSDTYYHNLRTSGPGLSGAESWLIRGKLRFDITDQLRLTLAGSYSDRSESVAIYGNPLNGNTLGRLLDPNAIIPTKPLDVALSDDSAPQRVKSYQISGKLVWEGPAGTLTSTTAYTNFKLRNVLDADYSYAPNGASVNYYVTTYEKYFSQEVTYASSMDGPFNFVIGGFYSDGEGAWFPLGVGNNLASAVTIYGLQKMKSAAGFGEVYYNITDKLSVIGGLRYSWERRTELGDKIFGSYNAPQPATLPVIGQRSADSLTPRASIRYALTPRSNLYFTYSQGFKSPLFNTSNVFFPDSVNSEKVFAYELGYKGRVSDTLSVNLAGFYYRYKDMQANAFRFIPGPNNTQIPLGVILNVPLARIWGGELEASWTPSPMFDARVGLSVLDAKYVDFTTAAVNLPCTDTASPCSVVGTPLNIGNRSVPYDASGKTMIRAPKFTGSATLNGHLPVAGGKLDASATLYYSGQTFFTFDHRINQPAYATVDARLQWSPENSGLSIAIWGKNLTDKVTLAGSFVTTVADGVSWSQPRTYGVEVGYKF